MTAESSGNVKEPGQFMACGGGGLSLDPDAMQIDLEDIMAGTLGRIVVIFLFLLSAIWLGSIIGAAAWQVGHDGFALPGFEDLLMCLLMQINLWIVPNVAFLAIMTVYLFVFDGIGHIAWGVIVAFESLFLMLGWCLHFEETKDTLLAWGSWLALLVMVETGIWLHRQMRTNRWAREMAELRAENAMIRAEREARAARGSEESTDSD